MGRASTRKRDRLPAPARTGADRWAGAYGMDEARRIAELMLAKFPVPNPTHRDGDRAEIALRGLQQSEYRLDLLTARLDALETVTAAHDPTFRPGARSRRRDEPTGSIDEISDAELERLADGALGYAVRATCGPLLDVLQRATPILFDPMVGPAEDERAYEGLSLPFSEVVADFADSTVTRLLPTSKAGPEGLEYVGLVAAVMRQDEPGGPIDCWPVIRTLVVPDASGHAVPLQGARDRRTTRPMAFGCCRLGGELGPAPQGMVRIVRDAVTCWATDIETEHRGGSVEEDVAPWALEWIIRPALLACSALCLLEAVNVDLQDAVLSRPDRRRAVREGRRPALEVVIRGSRSGAAAAAEATGRVEWSHRWTVRGHWKRFTRGPIFDANPRRRVNDVEVGWCVKVWTPPHVKGPDGLPVALKARRHHS